MDLNKRWFLLLVFVAGCAEFDRFAETVVTAAAICLGTFALLFLSVTLYALFKNLRAPSWSSVILGKLTGGIHACIGVLMAISVFGTLGDEVRTPPAPAPVETVEYVGADGRPIATPLATPPAAEDSTERATLLMSEVFGMGCLGLGWFFAGVGLVVVAGRAGKKLKLAAG